MRSKRYKKEIDPHPVMMRGESEFEERRIKCDFTLVFGKAAQLGLSSLSDTYEYVYRQAYFAGKAAGKRQSLGSPEETLSSPTDASVRETAGAQKEKQNGITKSD